MNVIAAAIRQPITMTVGVILIVMAGILALSQVPIQMTPTVNSIVIAVDTYWESASPNEIESDIIEEQESRLGNVAGLVRMTSNSSESSGSIRLQFDVGTDIKEALAEVTQKLDEVPNYPTGVTEPIVQAIDPDSIDYIAWVGLAATEPNFDNTTLYDFMERRLRPRLERITGIAEVGMVGAREEEVHLNINPQALAQRNITYQELISTIRQNNQNFSAGKLTSGKNDIRIRSIGRFEELEQMGDMIIRRDLSGPIYLRDVASIELAHKEMTSWVRARGVEMPFFNFQLERGANLLQTMDLLKAEMKTLSEPGGLLEQEANRRGIQGTLEMVQPYDASLYVDQAIGLVQSNIYVGGFLATLTLLIFLRSLSTIGIISIAIPISVLASIVLLVSMGRSINIISLAGMAFAVGMVIDNAIVVIENIYRHLEKGKSSSQAALDGTKEVGGAVLASTMTTLMVFLPILFIQETAGQLFRDIALAIMASVGLSLIVSLTVIPSAAARWLKLNKKVAKNQPASEEHYSSFAMAVGSFVGALMKNIGVRLAVIGLFCLVTVIGIWQLTPPIDYLPSGNRNFVMGLMFPPPGYSLDQKSEIGERLEQYMKPVWSNTDQKFQAEDFAGTKSEVLPPLMSAQGPIGVNAAPLDHYFIASFGDLIFQGGITEDASRAVDTLDYFNQVMYGPGSAPDVFAFSMQSPLFNSGGSTGSAIEIDISGDNIDQVVAVGQALMFSIAGEYGFQTTRPDPANFLLPTPELQITPNDARLRELGLTRQDVGFAVQANGDGLILFREVEVNGQLKDLKVITPEAQGDASIEALKNITLATPSGNIVDLRSIADIKQVRVQQTIKHVDRLRAVTIQFTAPKGMPLQTAIDSVNGMIAGLKTQGAIPPGIEVALAGSAGELKEIQTALMGDGTIASTLTSSLFLALVVVYLVMVVLFQNWRYPLVIMITVPLATFGGFVGLSLLHLYTEFDRYSPVQNLDVLTLIGFVILAGVVVNNAILIVHQALNFIRDHNFNAHQAIINSVQSRVRPIMMSTLTSVGGMLPLVLMPGAGSELYRGLGSVVVGGLLIATLFTLILVPLVLSFLLNDKAIEKIRSQQAETKKLDLHSEVDDLPTAMAKRSKQAVSAPTEPAL